ncbi:MAG: hypothetical protein U0894_04365 [Pirellulales bacterium]
MPSVPQDLRTGKSGGLTFSRDVQLVMGKLPRPEMPVPLAMEVLERIRAGFWDCQKVRY